MFKPSSPEIFFEKKTNWQEAYLELRRIILPFELSEEVKWGKPCYTLNGQNVVLIHGFKEYCALLFHKGALIDDPKNQLVQQTANVQAARQLRFVNVEDVLSRQMYIEHCVKCAIEVEAKGLKVDMKETAEFEMVDEFKQALDDNPELHAAFERLTPGRQRGYLLHFGQAKQSKTRMARIEKHWDRMLEGKGLND